ncbi:MAG: carboxy-S-adenosyl-L-methionine synthase CmoA [Proteobacteria bacterium]|nr:carboxy-S-adenosyl-L-methionine synthase CmoA [Pseudomonadota bacterium]
MKKDTLYKKPKKTVPPFEFNKSVVDVFDDMIHRSVPFYSERLTRMSQLAAMFYQNESRIYDLGCSNGNFGLHFLGEMGKKPFDMIAVDSSNAMLEAYRKRLSDRPNGDCIKLILDNIENVVIENTSVVIINLTLQFLPVSERDDIVRRIFDALLPQGILLMTEKVIHENDEMTRLQQDFYYRYKRENGYSNLEISQKRDALENVLIPEAIETHIKRFQTAGFRTIDIFQKWFNFSSFICIKS